MKAAFELIPALDLRGGRVVRLRTGDFSDETSYGDDPLALARAYEAAGAEALHLVDLDAARGAVAQESLVRRVVEGTGLAVQVAGGVRDEAVARRWLETGAASVVMGTTAVREPELLAEIARTHPRRVQAALDARAGAPAVAGWLETATERTIPELLRLWDAAPLAGVIVTSIDRDGTLAGPDLEVLRLARRSTAHRLTYSGGIGTLEDVAAVAAAGADAVILGRSLLEGRFTYAEARSTL
ncbi:MAG: 1-(5-phosphoribosyl)-5-[(5-phosphoribosylamino)methylideneamino] imidazole-4-carboxamide isomerase [Candidatus Dormibacteraeota bacterium]|nr:1-(5-phosphoribosyl)-5-[(5-phosphoribosylamino)methylideneamino] imidazole-4-carboxamide isomerase [Candidatus Dormibacteraeota bacterium]